MVRVLGGVATAIEAAPAVAEVATLASGGISTARKEIAQTEGSAITVAVAVLDTVDVTTIGISFAGAVIATPGALD